MGFYEKRAQRAAARTNRRNAPSPVGIGAQKLDTSESPPARLREDAQQPDMIAAILLRSFPMLQRRSNTAFRLRAASMLAGPLVSCNALFCGVSGTVDL